MPPVHRSSTRWAPRQAWWSRASRRSSCCRGRRASCSRCGTPRCKLRACRRRSRAARSTGRRWCGCSGCPSRAWPKRCASRRRTSTVRAARDHHLPASRRARDRHALRARAEPVYAELMECLREHHARQIFRRTARGSTIRWRRCSTGRRVGDGGVMHGGAGGRAAHGQPGSSAYVAGGVVAYANEAKWACSMWIRTDRSARGGVRTGGGGDGRGRLRRFEEDTAVAIDRNRRSGRRHQGEAGGKCAAP